MSQSIERLKSRLAAVTSGQAKMERFLKAEPNSPKAAEWKKRLQEYKTSAAGLPVLIKQMEDKIAARAPAKPTAH